MLSSRIVCSLVNFFFIAKYYELEVRIDNPEMNYGRYGTHVSGIPTGVKPDPAS